MVLIIFYLCGKPLHLCVFLISMTLYSLTHSKQSVYSISHRVNWEESVMKTNTSETLNERIIANTIEAGNSSSNDSESIAHEREVYLIIYACIMVVGTLCFLLRSFSFFRMCIRISINLHDMIFRGISRAKMIFFNNNPSGRILNRFARDINNVDSLLPNIIVDVFDVSTTSMTVYLCSWG